VNLLAQIVNDRYLMGMLGKAKSQSRTNKSGTTGNQYFQFKGSGGLILFLTADYTHAQVKSYRTYVIPPIQVIRHDPRSAIRKTMFGSEIASFFRAKIDITTSTYQLPDDQISIRGC
jgi:hypothetical protein